MIPKSDCIGCGVCVNKCNNNAIKLEKDETGFVYPLIDDSCCSKCHVCTNYCPVAVKHSKSQHEPDVYAAWSLDDYVRLNSSSGGIFTELAKSVIKQGGVVVGATLNSNFSVEHIFIENEFEIELLRRSKYTQSDTKDVYAKIQALLKNEKLVLFSGTPCQCAAVKAYLNHDYNNLILCDLICKGVNSDVAYQRYLVWLKDKYKSNISEIIMRDKNNGWLQWSIRVLFSNGEEYIAHHKEDPFIRGFLANLYLRPSCTNCNFKGVKRQVDITLGDFWGIMHDNDSDMLKGISVVFVHTTRGHDLFNEISNAIYFKKSSANDCVKKNPMLVESSYYNPKVLLFYSRGGVDFGELIDELLS